MAQRDSAKRLTTFSHGAGCACKLSADELAEIMHPLTNHRAYRAADLLVGTSTSDDAGVWRLPSGQNLVHTVDFFTPIVDDPRAWGRIAAANALSDVYAMGGTPLTALQIVAWPRTGPPFHLLQEVLKGGADVMAESGTTIVGGHSIEDPEPKYGFAVTGLVEKPITNAGAQPGDRLILTKPLGSGIITTAIKRGECPPGLAEKAIETMTELNAAACGAMLAARAHAATDITGFGLLGHLREILLASGVGAELDAQAIPTIGDLSPLLRAGHFPGGSQRNLAGIGPFLHGALPDPDRLRVLADAQTSGGLLISIPADGERQLLDALPMATAIGRVTAGPPNVTFS